MQKFRRIRDSDLRNINTGDITVRSINFSSQSRFHRSTVQFSLAISIGGAEVLIISRMDRAARRFSINHFAFIGGKTERTKN